MSAFLAQAAPAPHAASAAPLVTDPTGVLVVLLAVLAVIFWATQQPALKPFFKVVPALLFCYFVPTTLTTLGVIPADSVLYDWIKDHLLPAALFLLILALDVPGILRLGPKAVIMLLTGTAGVVIGGPIALYIGNLLLGGSPWALPADAWKGLAALSGSWIGGGANFVAIGQSVGITDAMLALMVIPDVFLANIWMGVLLYGSGVQHAIDRWTGANAQAIRDLERRLTDFQARVSRVTTLPDLMMIVALGFLASYVSYQAGRALPEVGDFVSHTTWKYILVTAVGVALSFTPVRNLEGAGASKVGSVMLYILVACIGAHANFADIVKAPGFVVVGALWMAVHVAVLLTVGWLIKAPIFFVAIGSQANIGGAASAPVVAAAYHPSLAPVGVLLAVAGYVLGTYAGLWCAAMLKSVAGASG